MRHPRKIFRLAFYALTMLLLATTANAMNFFSTNTADCTTCYGNFDNPTFQYEYNLITTATADFDDIGRPQNNQFNLTAMTCAQNAATNGDDYARQTHQTNNLNVRIPGDGHPLIFFDFSKINAMPDAMFATNYRQCVPIFLSKDSNFLPGATGGQFS